MRPAFLLPVCLLVALCASPAQAQGSWTNVSNNGVDDLNPFIWNGMTVWRQYSGFENWDAWFWDVYSGVPPQNISQSPYNAVYNPDNNSASRQIDAGKVVWAEQDLSQVWPIWVYDVNGNPPTTTQLTTGPGDKSLVARPAASP